MGDGGVFLRGRRCRRLLEEGRGDWIGRLVNSNSEEGLAHIGLSGEVMNDFRCVCIDMRDSCLVVNSVVKENETIRSKTRVLLTLNCLLVFLSKGKKLFYATYVHTRPIHTQTAYIQQLGKRRRPSSSCLQRAEMTSDHARDLDAHVAKVLALRREILCFYAGGWVISHHSNERELCDWGD